MGTQSSIGGYNVVLLSVYARCCSYGTNLCSLSNRASTLIQKNRGNDGASAPFFFFFFCFLFKKHRPRFFLLRGSGFGMSGHVGPMPTCPELFIRTAKNPNRPKKAEQFTRKIYPYFLPRKNTIRTIVRFFCII